MQSWTSIHSKQTGDVSDRLSGFAQTLAINDAYDLESSYGDLGTYT